MNYVIGVDSSTSGVKAVVFDQDGHQIAIGRASLTMNEPKPGWHEQDCRDWVSGLYTALDDLKSQIDLSEMKAIAVTCQRETVVLLDENDEPVRPAIVWMDTRATEQVERLGSEKVHAITGKPPATVNGLYKLIWLYENEPESIRRAKTVYDVSGYLMHKLTGIRATCFATADTLSLVDLNSEDYAEEVISLAGLTKDHFPPFVQTGETVGQITDEVARKTGLPQGLPVISTVGDGQAAGVGANVTGGDLAYLSLGTGIALGAAATNYSYSPAYRTLVGYAPGTYYLECLVANGSYLISWFIRKFEIEGDKETGESAEARLEAMARKVPPGSDGLFCVPYFNGCMTPHWDGDSRGAFIGWRGSHGQAEMYRAILEGISFDINLCLNGVNDARGKPIEGLIVMGGGANSSLWCQLLADLTGCYVQVCEQDEVTALGAAIHAAAGIGLCGTSSITETADRMTRLGKRFDPDAQIHDRYRRHFTIYETLYERLSQTYKSIADLAH
ncbi:xylulokinase [Paracoccaceae bacterium GXU_MW_L88]